ncbi:unnamed protein product, partial [Mesorhabditis belari]|uniref:Ribosome-recycling factor, mitochondrial n=1 Tax=Mesorhabditis belari TaxID=2138241 RepID=A0AAF3J7M5_9BILA
MLSRTITRCKLLGSVKESLALRLRPIHTTAIVQKVRKNENKDKKVDAAMHHAAQVASKNEFVSGALKEMDDCDKILEDELGKRFSFRIDTRIYEDILVPTNEKELARLGNIARISVKERTVSINMSQSPTLIKEAKLALQKSGAVASAVQQEGVCLYIQVPRMSRERREQLATDAEKIVFNQYKDELNKIFAKWDKKATASLKTNDERVYTRTQLLDLKKVREAKAHGVVKAKAAEHLREVI